jgi:hypothetical protein
MYKLVKYPYSNIQNHHSFYVRLVSKFFESTFNNLDFQIFATETTIKIIVRSVNPHAIYNPFNFDPEYKVFNLKDEIKTIGEAELFNQFYSYIPDIVPYLEFEFFAYPLMLDNVDLENPFKTFNLRQMYYDCEGRVNY